MIGGFVVRKETLASIRAEAARKQIPYEQLASELGIRPETFSRKLAGRKQHFTTLELKWLVMKLGIKEE